VADRQFVAGLLYTYLTAHYGFPDRRVLLTREQLAREVGVTVRTIGRCLAFLRDRHAIRTTDRRDPETGNCAGFELALAGVHYESTDQKDSTVSLAPSNQKDSTVPLGGDQKDFEGGGQKDSSVPIRSRSISTDQEDLAAVDHRGNKQQVATSTAAQQQHGPPTLPPKDEDPPTTDELSNAFYAGWEQTHGARCDRRRVDEGFIEEMVAVHGAFAVLEAIGLFFACTDVRIIGPDRLHPLGLLKANAGKLLAMASRLRVVVPTGPHRADLDPVINDPIKRAQIQRVLDENRALRH
jgi:hypothetical protein